MDLDDLIDDLLPKKQRKKLKKKLKKNSIWQLLFGWLMMLFTNSNRRELTDRHSAPPPRTYTDKKPQREKRKGPLFESLAQAQQYRDKIAVLVQSAEPDSVERMRLKLVSEKVDEWLMMIERIVQRAVSNQEDELLTAERKRVPAAIRRLEKQLEEADDPALRVKLERTLENRRKQLDQLKQSANNQQIAELKVENTLAQLGILYTQLHSGRYVAERSRYERLSAEIGDEIDTLEDYLDAYTELSAY